MKRIVAFLVTMACTQQAPNPSADSKLTGTSGMVAGDYTDPFDQLVEEFRVALLTAAHKSRQSPSENVRAESVVEAFIGSLRLASEEINHPDLKETILLSNFDDLVERVEPDFYMQVLSDAFPEASCEGDLAPVAAPPLPKHGDMPYSRPKESSATQPSETQESGSATAQTDQKNANEESDDDKKRSVSSRFLMVQIVLASMVTAQKAFNYANDIGVADKTNKKALRQAKVFNGASLGFSLVFIGLSAMLLAQGEDHQSQMLLHAFSAMILIDILVGIYEIRNLAVEANTIRTTFSSVRAEIDVDGKLRIRRVGGGYVSAFGSAAEGFKNMPSQYSTFAQLLIEKPSRLFSTGTDTHSEILDRSFTRLSQLQLDTHENGAYRQQLAALEQTRVDLEAALREPGANKRQIQAEIRTTTSEIDRITQGRIDQLLKSTAARDILAETITEAQKAGVDLNLPKGLAAFANRADPVALKADPEFRRAFEDAGAVRLERFAAPSSLPGVQGQTRTVRGAASSALAVQAAVMTAFSVYALNELRKTYLGLVDDETSKSHQDVMHSFRQVFAAKFDPACLN